MNLPHWRWVQRLFNWLGSDAFSEWEPLLHPSRDTILLDKRRASALLVRTRAAALLLTLLTGLFAALDALVFPAYLFGCLALARVGAGAALVGLSLALRRATSLAHARLGLALLFAIPSVFLFVSNALLSQAALGGVGGAGGAGGAATSVGGVYAFMPFAMAAAISIFPLAWFEALALGLMVMLVELGTAAMQNPYALALSSSGILWLALLVTVMSAIAGLNQMGLMAAIIVQSTHDPLTGCYVRSTGEDLVGMCFAMAVRQRQPLSVVFLDLDHFKAVNDQFGHERGDKILAQAGAAFKAAVRASDLPLRWGGEEFLLVLPDTDYAAAVVFVQRLMDTGLGLRPDNTPLTASMGIASFPSDGVGHWSALVELADQRMYLAKQAGRNCFVGQ